MKKILLTTIVVLCFGSLAVAQNEDKAARKKAVNPTLLYSPSALYTARNKAKAANAKSLELGQTTPGTTATSPKSKVTTAPRVDSQNN